MKLKTPTCQEFGEKFVSSKEKKMMEADVQGHCLIMSVAVNKRMLGPRRRKNHQQQQTEIKDEIKAVHRHHNEGAGKFQVGSVVSKRNLVLV